MSDSSIKSINSFKSRLIIFSTIGLDALGIGLVFPFMPKLLQDVTGRSDIGKRKPSAVCSH